MDITADVDIGITQFVQQSEELRKKIRGQWHSKSYLSIGTT
jgi:hypothetical protein